MLSKETPRAPGKIDMKKRRLETNSSSENLETSGYIVERQSENALHLIQTSSIPEETPKRKQPKKRGTTRSKNLLKLWPVLQDYVKVKFCLYSFKIRNKVDYRSRVMISRFRYT